MNEIRRIASEAEEIDRIRAIVARHRHPDFVVGFDVLLSTVDAEPAVWIIFQTTGTRPQSFDARKALADQANELVDSVHKDLRDQVGDRYPYYRFYHPNQD